MNVTAKTGTQCKVGKTKKDALTVWVEESDLTIPAYLFVAIPLFEQTARTEEKLSL